MIARRRWVLAALACLGLISSCGAVHRPPTSPSVSAPVQAQTPDEGFLADLQQHGVHWSTDAGEIQLAHDFCADFDTGYTPQDIYTATVTADSITVAEAGTILGAGVYYYCPEYTQVLRDFTNG